MRKKITRKDGVVQIINYDSDHPNWKNGKTQNGSGYILINTSQDPMFCAPQTLEHRYVMAKYLGRKLYANEHIHHINGDKTDNRIENLQIIGNAEHWELHNSHRRGVHFILKERKCPECSDKFFPKSGHNGSKQKYCSKTCSMKVVWRRDKKIRKTKSI